MSMFLGQSFGGFDSSRLQQSDGRVMQKDFQWDFTGSHKEWEPWMNGMLWSSSRFFGDGSSFPLGTEVFSRSRWDTDQQQILGGQQQKKIIGITLDSAGNPLGSCVVQAFVTATDLLAAQLISDSAGYFECPTTYVGQAHYLVCYLAGAPDVAGTSVNTLLPV